MSEATPLYTGEKMQEVSAKIARFSSRSDFGSVASMESYAKDYVDQKFETERAKTDTRFVEVLNEIRLLRQSTITKWQFFGGLGTAVATILGVLLTVLAFAGDRFDAGINVSDDLMRIQAEQVERDAAQDARLDKILAAIDALSADKP